MFESVSFGKSWTRVLSRQNMN